MLKLNLKRFAGTLLSAALLCSTMVSMPAAAGAAEDKMVAAFKAEMLKQMQVGVQQATQERQQKDAAALAGDDCKAIDKNAMDAAKQFLAINSPPDPTKIIQNTTCFVDVAMTKIPVILTGIGFIDSIIRDRVQTYLTGQCSKSMNFLNGLKTDAMQQLNNATGGAAGLLQGYANTAVGATTGGGESAMNATLAQLQAYSSSSATAPSTSGAPVAGVDVTAGFQTIRDDYKSTTSRLMCQYNIADATHCPTCLSNPTHASCLEPRPSCESRPDLNGQFCVNNSSGSSDPNQGGSS